MLKVVLASTLLLAAAACVSAQDPADSWLSYAAYQASPSAKVTMLNATWKVPAMPKNLYASNAPGWWFGIQTANGNGALIQPILAFADGEPVYTIFNGVFDWNDQSWYQSDATQVYPGQTIFASITYDDASNTYTMFTQCVETGWSVTSTKKVKSGQIEAVSYFVLEHQPDSCDSYPADNQMSFYNIYLEIEHKPVTPQWKALQQQPACNSKATIVSPSVIKFVWDTSAVVETEPAHLMNFRRPSPSVAGIN